ncbi:probable serine/threonine-protein kinase DDB_G0282963 [Toxorhynchites rutilus septentrionalis]|uniref:probable serine/threonine-protein kinase DDB_G0282963 n=1 Tax=Toxorhynchites rutilus septentrionalis TaxID=329112 RepID=UPI00247914CE|nr:probable serine/threonine-protein kinase DDB_G0282963 [Toxorhynchites rutilus septentrionalis]XP_055616142.1 probable serine/threonine-protein kinase DDB_G0282963 [Toxorhynchites rutilus septentrionalis]XP_055616143.1 probable serine/threonine-protein kinase DDB_G0282963 [Toxorhynchites rutilus septentrionalis]XP_055616145.1 probable serine/threonine-protein kinase DDB_G0282963 [Toxorhynchites rutilus septentrionalis]
MELSAMGGRRLTSQQIQQLQQAHQQQQQQIQQLQQLQHYQHQQLQQQQHTQAMLFQQQQQQQQQQHSIQQIPPPPMGGGGGNPLHRSAQRFSVSRHRKDSLGKSVSKYMYPPGSPSMGFNENIYHPQNTTSASAANANTANSKHNRYPEPDPDIIEVYLEDDPIKLKEAVRDGKEIKWRNNIVATMERYDPGPISAATLPSSYLQQHHQSSTDSSLNPEYSYAYCEPMILKQQSLQQQQQQLPQPGGQLHPNSLPQIHKLSSSASSNALSKLPSTNSLRALLSKSFRKSSLSANTPGSSTVGPGTPGGVIPEKHTFTTRYGTKENIYEDVGAGSNLVGTAAAATTGGTKPLTGATNSTSMQSFESIQKFNIHDELRHVQSQHDRILGELNLSVETLIMPSKDEQDAIEERLNEIHCAQYHDEMSQDDCIAAGSSNSAMIHMQERLSPTTSQPNSGDVDSGISGSSSSGASYSSSMLYRTTTMYTNNSKTVTINDSAEGSGSGMSMLAGSSSIRSSCGSSSGCGSVPVAYSSCGGGASCSKMASNIVIPNSNKLACCFYSDKLSKTSKSNSDHLDTLADKSSFWNKLGKLKISGVFGGANNSSSSSNGSSASHSHLHNQHFHPPHHHHHPHPHLHHHHNHTLPSHLHQLQGLNHSVPTTTTNTATIARSNESENPHIHLHHHRLPSPLVTTTIEPWWQTPSDPCLMDPSSTCGGEYQLPCEVLVPPPQPPPPSLSALISGGGVGMRPPLPQPPLQTQIELEEDEEDQKVEEHEDGVAQ